MSLLKFLAQNSNLIANGMADVIRFTARADYKKIDKILNNLELKLEESLAEKIKENKAKIPTKKELSDEEIKKASKDATSEILNLFSSNLFNMSWYDFKLNAKSMLRQYNSKK